MRSYSASLIGREIGADSRVDRRASGQQGSGPGRSPVVLQRTKLWIERGRDGSGLIANRREASAAVAPADEIKAVGFK